MTDQEINIAIAEACGWINQGKAKGIFALEHRWTRKGVHPKFVNTDQLPDYANDLNAMAEAEETIFNKKEWIRYTDWLVDTIMPKNESPIRATARQRAEAFLRVRGLWKDKTPGEKS